MYRINAPVNVMPQGQQDVQTLSILTQYCQTPQHWSRLDVNPHANQGLYKFLLQNSMSEFSCAHITQ